MVNNYSYTFGSMTFIEFANTYPNTASYILYEIWGFTLACKFIHQHSHVTPALSNCFIENKYNTYILCENKMLSFEQLYSSCMVPIEVVNIIAEVRKYARVHDVLIPIIIEYILQHMLWVARMRGIYGNTKIPLVIKNSLY